MGIDKLDVTFNLNTKIDSTDIRHIWIEKFDCTLCGARKNENCNINPPSDCFIHTSKEFRGV